ncbi:MAG TPA: hypothetical protein VFK44_06610 [Bacillales bacterium]|nr:hypothetical protein [Bacillales bacterium]
MLYVLINVVVKLIAYSMMIYGLWLLVGAPFLAAQFSEGFYRYKRRRRARRIQELAALKEKNETKTHSRFYRHLELILSSVKKNYQETAVFNFLFLTAILFGVNFILMVLSMKDLVLSAFVSGLLAALPYFFLRVRLTAIRSRTSLLFLSYFPVILQNYQSSNKDLYFALAESIPQIKNSEMQRVYMKLLNALQLKRTRAEFEESVRIFVYSINSTFAKRFGKLVIRAHLERADVSESFSQLDADIRKRKSDMQSEKTKNFDTVNLGFLPIATIPFAFYFAHSLSGVLDFWYFFQQKTNLTLFVITVVGGILCVSTSFLLRKPKADL